MSDRLNVYLATIDSARDRGRLRDTLTRLQGFSGREMMRYVFAERIASGAYFDQSKNRLYERAGANSFYSAENVTQALVNYVLWLQAQSATPAISPAQLDRFDKKAALERNGFTVGDRDPRLNAGTSGRYMVAQNYLPAIATRASFANWCVVGDNLFALIETAFDSLVELTRPKLEFGLGEYGLRVAKVNDHAYALLPRKSGGFAFAGGWATPKPFEKYELEDFGIVFEPQIAPETFHEHVFEMAHHHHQKAFLGRARRRADDPTPWGQADEVEHYSEAIRFFSTPSHGGFRVQEAFNQRIPAIIRAKDSWYEEDEHWCAVAVTFPHLFTDFELKSADRTLRNSFPDAWEAIHQKRLMPGESRARDEQNFLKDHAQDWIVTSAITSKENPGMVEVFATIGGRRDGSTQERRFLVPADEYHPLFFVIDEARHRPYAGPSSFIGAL